MSLTFDTSKWLNFFLKAGLPPNVAANYALIFSDNRIQTDMFMDLSKEYLYDMGIRVMGDVIAILRYAKEFHTQMAKEKAIGPTVTLPNKAVGRMVGHYTRSRLSPQLSPPIRNRQIPQAVPKKSNIISLKRSASAELPAVKKVRKVPPEEEGAYKIKMPAGTTERTRKILQKQQLVQGSKRSVFARLGDSAVSSSTDLAKTSKPLSKTSSSVFERLGPTSKNAADDMPTSTVLGETKKTVIKINPLQYQGILKITSGNRRIVSTGVKANRTVIKPLSQRLNIAHKISLKPSTKFSSLQHINTILQSSTDGTQGILGKPKFQSKATVKDRLGLNMVTRSLAKTKLNSPYKRLGTRQSANVFDRLGN